MPVPRQFTVQGPFRVPLEGPTGARSIAYDNLDEFWATEARPWGTKCGCYVFALRRGRGGYQPLYVGKTSRQKFDRECFSDRNYRLLDHAMRRERGALVLFLLVHQSTRGRPDN